MEYNEILKRIAPCGLNCYKCMAFEEGSIKEHASQLKELLGPEFDRYAKRFSSFMPVFEKYPEFKKMLHHFTQGDCIGCRSGECKYPNCGVMSCFKDRGVDFCFECDEFPCDHSNLDPDLKERWIKMNNRMKKVGVEQFYKESMEGLRYP